MNDLLQTGDGGRGVVNILVADKLMNSPIVYSTLLLWLLSELYEKLPEVGDRDKPKLVFFFDEAHLLFTDAPKTLLDKIEQVVRLIRSKGVGVYFVTQNPLDVPETVLGGSAIASSTLRVHPVIRGGQGGGERCGQPENRHGKSVTGRRR
jgi:DNA helicase HerA-like ATPase